MEKKERKERKKRKKERIINLIISRVT